MLLRKWMGGVTWCLGRTIQGHPRALPFQQGDSAASDPVRVAAVEGVTAQVGIGRPAAEKMIRRPEDGMRDGGDRLLVAPMAHDPTAARAQGGSARFTVARFCQVLDGVPHVPTGQADSGDRRGHGRQERAAPSSPQPGRSRLRRRDLRRGAAVGLPKARLLQVEALAPPSQAVQDGVGIALRVVHLSVAGSYTS